jgi:pyruvate kinase
MKRYILTVGPSLLHNPTISEIHKPAYIYRINGAHGSVNDIEDYIFKIRAQIPDADILMDLPGNKIRTKGTNINIKTGKEFAIPCTGFNYPNFFKLLTPGMTVWANDSVFEFEVKNVSAEEIVFLSKSTGVLTDNKGVHVRNIHANLPFLFEKDKDLIGLANKHKISFVGLSFVRNRSDIEIAQELIKHGEIISKVETLAAVKNLNEILEAVEYILVDRGDLSTEIGIENIPHYQQFIIEKALYFNRKIFLATQILKNMETKPIPTIAEIDDLYSISKKGVYGIQLSEETAIGGYVKECIAILEKMAKVIIHEYIK